MMAEVEGRINAQESGRWIIVQGCREKSAGEAFAVDGEAVDGAEDGDGDAVRLEEGAGELLDLLGGNGFDAGEDFVEGGEAVEVEFLASEIGHARAGGFEREHQRALEVVLGATQLFLGNRRIFHGAKFGDGEIENLADGFLAGAGVNGEHSGVGVRREFAEDGVGEALLFANVLEEARGHAAAEKIIEHGHGEAAFVGDGQGRNAEAEVDLLEIALFFEMNRRAGGGRRVVFFQCGGGQVAEFFFDEIENLLVGDVAGSGDQDVIGREPVLEAAAQGRLIEFADGFRGSEKGATERMLGPEAAGKNVVEEIFGIVEIHLDLFEDHLAFFADVVGIETRAEDEIGDDVESDGQMLVENLGVETDLFFGGEGIEHAADGIHFAGDIFGGAAFGAFEDHVLEEMSEAVFGGVFAAGAIADPDADGDGADMLHGLGDDDQSVGKNVTLDVAGLRDHTVLWHRVGEVASLEFS